MEARRQQARKRFDGLAIMAMSIWLLTSIASADFDTLSGHEAEASERWTASGGQTGIRFDPGLMDAFQMTASGSEALRSAEQPGDHRLYVSSLGALDIWAPNAAFDGFAGGELKHSGKLVLDYPGGSVSLRNFSLRPSSGDRLDLVTESGEILFQLDYIHAMPRPEGATLDLWNMDLRISASLAARLGQPQAEGMVIGSAFTRTALKIPSGAQIVGLCSSPNWHDGINFITDVQLYDIGDVQQVARQAGVRVAVAPSASLRNVGTADVPWYAKFTTGLGGTYPQPYGRDQHPFLAWAMYREVDGRFEQIAASQLKHAFFTVNSSCGCSGGSILWSANSAPTGMGCSDVYGVSTNDDTTRLGPREELPAFTGAWEQCGSFFAPGATPPGPCDEENNGFTSDEFERRLVVAESDLQTADASYWLESWYVIRDDSNIFNSMARVSITPTLPGTTWFFSPGITSQGAVIDDWVAPGVSEALQAHVRSATGSGQYSLAVKAQDLGDGVYRYVYALMNYDYDPQFKSMALELPSGLVVSNITYSDADNDSANDWVASTTGGELKWTAPTTAGLDWGRMATFSFEANAVPTAGVVSLAAKESADSFKVSILALTDAVKIFSNGFESQNPGP